jgi:methyl-accepting chemotaxis protein
VKKVTDIVSEIAAASHEQSSGIEQVNKAVMQLDELTQQNAALVEEASAASQAMADQARGLNTSMQRYRVDAGMQSAASSTASPGARPEAASISEQTAGAGKAVAREPGAAKAAVERRGASRPWSGKSAKPAADAALAKRAANGDDESSWKEF